MPTLWIIDGYNFIRQSRRFAEQEARNGAKGRESALAWLGRFQDTTGERVRVVFDAYSGLEREPTVGQKFGVEVWLSRGGYTADEEIVALAENMREACIVVSSDRAVLAGSIRGGASIIHSDEFEREVGKILDRGFADEEEEENGGRIKGRAYHPPKEKKKAYLLLRKYQ